MTRAEREWKADVALDLSARGFNYTRIAEHLDVSWTTAKKLVDDELAKRAEHRGVDKERHLAHYDAIQSAAWAAFRNTNEKSLNRSGYLNTIKAAEDSKAKITGAEAPIKTDNRHRHEPTATEREAKGLADEIAALEAELLSEEAAATSAEEGEV